MVIYKAHSSLLALEDRWFLASTDRLHPLKTPSPGADATAHALNMPVPVRAFIPQPDDFKFELPSLSSGNSLSLMPPRVSALKEVRAISNRQNLPRIRTPPSDLWNLLDVKSAPSQQHTIAHPCGPTSSSDGSSLHSQECKSTSTGGSMLADRRAPISMRGQSPIGTGRPKGYESGSRQVEGRTTHEAFISSLGSPSSRLSPPSPTSDDTILVSISPGVAARRKTPAPPSRSFYDVLLENKRRHPHAPTMVSMLNPLREQVTFRAWACIPVLSGGQKSGSKAAETLALPSSKFQTSLTTLQYDTRSRKACDLACSNLRTSKRFYLRKNSYHCNHCKQDSMHKKLLVLIYFSNHFRNLFNKPSWHNRTPRSTNALKLETNSVMDGLFGAPPMIVDSESLMEEEEDFDILDTPLLKDLDDFDDFDDALEDMEEVVISDDDEDALLLEEIHVDGDTAMQGILS